MINRVDLIWGRPSVKDGVEARTCGIRINGISMEAAMENVFPRMYAGIVGREFTSLMRGIAEKYAKALHTTVVETHVNDGSWHGDEPPLEPLAAENARLRASEAAAVARLRLLGTVLRDIIAEGTPT